MQVCPESADVLNWLYSYRQSIDCTIERIAFADSEEWAFDDDGSALRHSSGKFFAIQGYRGESNHRGEFCQPLINQPETGTQGFVVRRRGDEFELLVQARTEPGNVGLVQIGPTIQATYSNYTAVHQGRQQPFLELFHHPERYEAQVLVDTVQPERGSKFLRKWNRNIVIEAIGPSEFEHPMFKWVSLKTLTRLMQIDHLVNNDARLVVGLLALEHGEQLFGKTNNHLGELVHHSLRKTSAGSFDSIIAASNWIELNRTRTQLTAVEQSLNELSGWTVGEHEITHNQQRYFSVIQVRVHAGDREVTDWDQPLISTAHKGEVVLLCRECDGELLLLLHAESQLGNACGAQLQPTYCFDNEETPHVEPVIRDLLQDNRIRQQFSFEASDEGGRFFQCITRYNIRLLVSSVNPELPSNYCWLTLGQIRMLLAEGDDYVSDETRSVLSLFLTAAYCSQFDHELRRREAA